MENLIIDPEFKELIPPLMTEDYQKLEESIVAEGCRDALVVWNNTLIDGHNRYEICQKHGLPFKTTEMQFNSRNEAMLWMINNQLARRNLSAADRIILAGRQRPILESIAKERRKEARQVYKKDDALASESSFVKSDNSTLTNESEDFSKLNKTEQELAINREVQEALNDVIGARFGQTYDEFKEATTPEEKKKIHVRDEIAKLACVSSGTVAKFEKIQKQKPELIEEIRTHKMSIDAAYNVLKEDERAEREQKREEQRQENAKKIERLTTPLEAQGLFQTIVIDPPWDWGDEGDINQMGRAKPDYHTMPIEEIEALPIGKIADDNCHLYLWVTNRSLPKAFRLIDAWGFRYITCLTWVKPSFGMGNYFRGSTEQVLFAVKGSQPLKRKDVGTHFEAPRGEGHSAKPDEFYKLVESCSYAPYIDIFGRKEKENWTVWGENG